MKIYEILGGLGGLEGFKLRTAFTRFKKQGLGGPNMLLGHSWCVEVPVIKPISQIDFASRFPPRRREARKQKMDLGTSKFESGACDLAPNGSTNQQT